MATQTPVPGSKRRRPRIPRGQWLGQVRTAYTMTRRSDPKIGLYVAGVFLLVLALFVLIGVLVGHPVYVTFVGLPFAGLAAAFLFGRRAERAAYGSLAGQPGAAYAVLNGIRRGWNVTQGVAVTPTRDPSQAGMVHRAVGRPGVVLVAEGPPARAVGLLAQEKKKYGRVVPDVPIFDFVVGDGEGQIRLTRLQRELMKLPRTLRPAEVTEVERRLKAVRSLTVTAPKGPMPKGMRMPRGPRP